MTLTDRRLAALELAIQEQTAILRRIQTWFLDAPVSAPGDPADVRLVAAIGAVCGEQATFTSAEVCRHAAADAELSAALLAADVENAKQLGWRLQRLSRAPIGGWTLSRVDSSREGIRWALVSYTEHARPED